MRKVLFLFIMLMIPVGIILFLHGFGENRFEVPVFYANAAEMSSDLCVFQEGQHYIPSFTFNNQANAAVSQSALEGKLTVVDFIFTNCPTICKEMSSEMRRVQEAFRGDEQLQLVSFTVDPERDTPEVLKAYASRVGANTANWHFLSGDKSDLYQMARCGFLLPVQAGDGSDEDFIHSNKLVLVDSQKRIRGYYNGDDRQDVDRLIHEIKIIKLDN